jgi:hypothetical protein
LPAAKPEISPLPTIEVTGMQLPPVATAPQHMIQPPAPKLPDIGPPGTVLVPPLISAAQAPAPIAEAVPPPIKLVEPKRADPLPLIPNTELPVPTKPVTPKVIAKAELKLSRPRLDVLRGEEVLLKVCADSLDVRGPVEKEVAHRPMKAAGKVSFTTPGCSGTCDELTIFPKTGEVVLTGNVVMTCREGKGETQLSAELLKFKVPMSSGNNLPDPSAIVPVTFK